MKFETLNYVHDLLKQNLKVKQGALELANRTIEEAVENSGDNIDLLKEIRGTAMQELWEAENAMKDFKNHEWR